MKPLLPLGLAFIACSGAWAQTPPPAAPTMLQAQLLAEHAHSRLHSAQTSQIRPLRRLSPIQLQQQQYNTAHSAALVANFSAQNNDLQSSGCQSPADLQPLSGAALISAIESSSLTGCLYQLYNQSLPSTALYQDANLQTVVNAVNQRLQQFDGSNASGAAELEKLVTYLRAFHWANWGNNRVLPQTYQAAMQQMFDQYFAGEHFVRFDGSSSRNFMLRYEMLILVRSAGVETLRYMKRFSQALRGYGQSVSRANNWGVSYEENGMTQLLTQFFNESSSASPAYQQLLQQQPEIISNLAAFIEQDGLWLLGHTREYQFNDAVTEYARLLKFGGAIASTVRPLVQQVLSQYSFGGVGSQAWVNAQSMVKAYDSANCALYGNACQFDLEAVVLNGRHQCGSTLKIRFQGTLSDDKLSGICEKLAVQEQKFHQMMGTTPAQPVANDQNTDLEIVIFKSSTDYQNYAGEFFGIDTDNGGMYLEGSPAVPGNQARFIAYQATWLAPQFVVWNLEHEYVHYLDGRFNQWGAFADQSANSVWWSEGLAEYLSQPEHNPAALAVAPNKTYPLSTLFQTTYANSNTERTYRWGYLAVRYMFERQRAAIDNDLLPTLRAAKYLVSEAPCAFAWGWRAKPEAIANNWSWLYDDSAWSSGYWVWTCGQPKTDGDVLPPFVPYNEVIDNWGLRFDSSFSQWLDCLVAGRGVCQAFRRGDLDQNHAIDQRDVELFNTILRQKPAYRADYDFNLDNKVNAADVPALTRLCDLARCAVAPAI